jgi:hypothetical protein
MIIDTDTDTDTPIEATEILTPDRVPAVTNVSEIESLAERFSIEAQTDLKMAEAVTVVDDATYEQAGQLRVAIDKKRKGGEGIVSLVCDPLYQKWKSFRALLMNPVETRSQALKILSDKRLTYERAQQAKAEAERKRLEEEARKEQERLNRLALERAQRAENRGDVAQAAEILENVPQVPIPLAPVGPVVAKTKGVAKVTYWSAQVIAFPSLVTAVAAGEVPMDALLPNQAWLNKAASALRANMKYPGVRAVSEEKERGTGR